MINHISINFYKVFLVLLDWQMCVGTVGNSTAVLPNCPSLCIGSQRAAIASGRATKQFYFNIMNYIL